MGNELGYRAPKRSDWGSRNCKVGVERQKVWMTLGFYIRVKVGVLFRGLGFTGRVQWLGLGPWIVSQIGTKRPRLGHIFSSLGQMGLGAGHYWQSPGQCRISGTWKNWDNKTGAGTVAPVAPLAWDIF